MKYFIVVMLLIASTVSLAQTQPSTIRRSRTILSGQSSTFIDTNATPTQYTFAYTAPDTSPCTWRVSTDPTFATVVNDVNSSLFTDANSDARSEALTSGTQRIFVIGERTVELALDTNYYSRALQADTLYHWERTCTGPQVTTGTFTTSTIRPGMYNNDMPIPNSATGHWYTPSLLPGARGTQIVDALSGTLYIQQTQGSDIGDGAQKGWNQGFGGLTRPHTNTLFTAGDGAQGYVSCYWDDNAFGGMYFFIPATGEVRFIGQPTGIVYPVMDDNKNFVQYRTDLTPIGMYFIPYTGTFMTGDYTTGTPVLAMANSSGGPCVALNIYDPTTYPTPLTDYECSVIATYANQYTMFSFSNTGYPAQDAPGVVGVMWGGDGRPYDSTCSAGPTLCPHVVAAVIIGNPANPNGCTRHNNELWTPDTVQLNLKANDNSCPGSVGASINFWTFLTDPNGTSITPAPWDHGGHDDIKGPNPYASNGTGGANPIGPTARVEEGSAFCGGGNCAYDGVIANPQNGSYTTSPSKLEDASNPFAGTSGPASYGLVRHPNWEQDPLQSNSNNAATFWDQVPYGGGGGPGVDDIVAASVTLVSGKTNTYLFVGRQTLHYKQQDTVAKSQNFALVDISGPSSTLADTFGLNQYCVVIQSGECVGGSSPGDIYFNPPSTLAALGCAGAESPNNFLYDICIVDTSVHLMSVGQFWGTQLSDASNKSRMLGHGLALAPTYASSYATTKPYPSGDWVSVMVGLNYSDPTQWSNIWAAKVPTYPIPDGKDRSTFLRASIPVTVPTGLGIDGVTVEFGYARFGTPTLHYCTSRRETCVVGASSVTDSNPFQYKVTETPVILSCTVSCTPVIPVRPGGTAYWVVKFYNGSTFVQDGESGVAIEDKVLSIGVPSTGYGLSLDTDTSAGYFPGLHKLLDWYNSTASGCTVGSGQCVGHLPQGDTYFWTAWAADATQLPVTSGLPIVGTANDVNFGALGCTDANIILLQLDTWNWATPLASHMSLINCMFDYGSSSSHNTPSGWNGSLTSGDGESLGTWKSRTPFYRNGLLYLPVERQFSPGNPSIHDASMIVSPDGGQHWCNPYTLFNVGTSSGVCNSSKWSANGDAPSCGNSGSATPCTNAGYTDATHSSIMWKALPLGTENWYWLNPGVQDGATRVDAPGCEFSTYDCFISYDGSFAKVALADNLLDISKWHYYTCPAITQNTRCDPSGLTNFTTTFANRTGTFYWSWNADIFQYSNYLPFPFGVQYLSEFNLWVMSSATTGSVGTNLNLLWSTSAVGPWFQFANVPVTGPIWPSFFSPSPALGKDVVTSSPPHVRYSLNSNNYLGGQGSPLIYQMGIQQGTTPTPFPILTTGLEWGFTFQDQVPAVSTIGLWPYFLDTANNSVVLVPCSGGANATAMGNCGNQNAGQGTNINTNGVVVTDTSEGYYGQYKSFNGEMFRLNPVVQNAPSAMQGNGTYTVISVFQWNGGDPPFGRFGGIWQTGVSSATDNTQVNFGAYSTGATKLMWNSQFQPGYSYSPAFTLVAGNWYMIAVVVNAAVSSNCPVTQIYVGTGGTITDKNAAISCVAENGVSSKTPAVGSAPFIVGMSGMGDTASGTHAFHGIYNRALSSGEINTIYGQMQTYMLSSRGVTIQ